MFTTTKQILSNNKVVPAFNFSTTEVAKAVVEVCEEKGQDVILQTSVSEAEFLGPEVAAGVAKALGQRSKNSVSLHLDHADNLEVIKAALDAGYTSFLAGSSKISWEFDESVEFVRSIKGLKGLKDILVEAALYEFDRAAEFVEKAQPDLLAPFSIVNGEDQTEIDKITHVRKFVNGPLVLHDGSSKSEKEIKEAISLGVVKINFNTCLREAWTDSLRKTLNSSPTEIKPYNLLKSSVSAVREVVRKRLEILE